jgi:hypothetical protein
MQKSLIKQPGDTWTNGGAFKRWLYRGQKPHWLAKTLNRMWAALASSGAGPAINATLEVSGRKSGRVVSFPVVPAYLGGQRYLVSMLGESAQWVLNVRAAGGKAVLRRGDREEVHLKEVPVGERAPILKAYLQIADGAQPHMPVNKEAPLSEFEKIAAEYPVFRVLSDGAA